MEGSSYTLQGLLKSQGPCDANITMIVQWKRYTYPTVKAQIHFCNGNSINFKKSQIKHW